MHKAIFNFEHQLYNLLFYNILVTLIKRAQINDSCLTF